MNYIKLISDTLFLIGLCFFFIFLYQNGFYEVMASEFNNDSISTIFNTVIGIQGVVYSVFIAIILTVPQLLGQKSYSRFSTFFFSNSSSRYFLSISLMMFVNFVLFIFFTLYESSYLILPFISLFMSYVLCFFSYALSQMTLFSYEDMAHNVLKIVTYKSILNYKLVKFDNGKYSITVFNHRHNYIDPLGPFHDYVSEFKTPKNRIVMNLCFSALCKKIINLNGCYYDRSFGLGNQKRKLSNKFLSKLILKLSVKEEIKVKTTIHLLHYYIKSIDKLITDSGYDVHRKEFTINCFNMIQSLVICKKNKIQIQMLLFAILLISLKINFVKPHGEYEPLNELYKIGEILKNNKFNNEYNLFLNIYFLIMKSIESVHVQRIKLINKMAQNIQFLEVNEAEVLDFQTCYESSIWSERINELVNQV